MDRIIKPPTITKALDFEKAKKFAIAQHKAVKQKYGDKPYSYHLEQVDWWAKSYSELLERDMGDMDYFWLVRAGAFVHDLLEDTKITFNDLAKETNAEIAEIAFLLQTPKGRNRKERHCDAYYQGIATSRVATFVKIADRIANVQHCLDSKSTMFYKYKQEQEHFAQFLEAPYPELDKMWDHLYRLLRHEPYPSFV